MNSRVGVWLFLRGIAFVYLVAFLSLGSQITGLIGEQGILPAADYLQRVRVALPGSHLSALPTLGWFAASDQALLTFCFSGALLAVIALAGAFSGPSLVVCYVLYLSLANLGQAFLRFQWDVLLTEAGFLAILVAPWSMKPRWPAQTMAPARPAVWLLRLLLFKLMFSSGVTKLTWDDPTWWDLSALSYHYWTQPIPTWFGWYAHQLPSWWHRLSCGVMFLIEIVLPFGVFGPRRARLAAFWGFVLLQLLIALTGNYGFFNLLTLVLCLPLLEDGDLPRQLRSRIRSQAGPMADAPNRHFVLIPITSLMALLNVVPITETFRSGFWADRPDHPLTVLGARARPFLISGSYGLFRTMTTTRPEIEIQGSLDGSSWKSYEFRFKPGAVSSAPPFVAPHMPRLDWQMWFAALASDQLRAHGPDGVRHWWNVQDPWVQRLALRLFEAEPTVLALFARDPFGGSRPKQLRFVLWRYAYTTWERRAEGWWSRERVGVLLGPIRAPGAPPTAGSP